MTGGGASTEVHIRPESPADHPALRALLVEAFAGRAEADLVEALRADDAVAVALAAVAGGASVGHVVFSPMRAPSGALGLAPLAVASEMRRRGIGARLVVAGLDAAQAAGWRAVFVLGDPTYYGRFGFTASAAEPFASPYAGPHLMALELAPGGLGQGGLGQGGRADYAAAFEALA